MKSIQDLEQLFQSGFKLSQETTGRTTYDWREKEGSIAFSKLCLHCASFLRLLPTSSYCSPIGDTQVWDLSSVASLARNIMEVYLNVFYLIGDKCSQQESDLRLCIWKYHESFERLKMLRENNPASSRIAQLEQIFQQRRSKLLLSPIFLKMGQDDRSRILKGRTYRLRSNIDLCRKAGISEKYFRSMFKYGSNHTHSSPFSMSEMDGFSANDQDASDVFNISLSAVTGFLAFGIRDYLNVFPDQIGKMSIDTRTRIEFWEEIFKWEKSSYFNGIKP